MSSFLHWKGKYSVEPTGKQKTPIFLLPRLFVQISYFDSLVLLDDTWRQEILLTWSTYSHTRVRGETCRWLAWFGEWLSCCPLSWTFKNMASYSGAFSELGVRLENFRVTMCYADWQWAECCRLVVLVLLFMSSHSSHFKDIIQVCFKKFCTLFDALGSTFSGDTTEISSLFSLFLLSEFLLPIDNKFFGFSVWAMPLIKRETISAWFCKTSANNVTEKQYGFSCLSHLMVSEVCQKVSEFSFKLEQSSWLKLAFPLLACKIFCSGNLTLFLTGDEEEATAFRENILLPTFKICTFWNSFCLASE